MLAELFRERPFSDVHLLEKPKALSGAECFGYDQDAFRSVAVIPEAECAWGTGETS